MFARNDQKSDSQLAVATGVAIFLITMTLGVVLYSPEQFTAFRPKFESASSSTVTVPVPPAETLNSAVAQQPTTPVPITNKLKRKAKHHRRVEHSAERDYYDDWSTLPQKRLLILKFVSVERMDEYKKEWDGQEKFLMGSLKNVSILLGLPLYDWPIVRDGLVKDCKWEFQKNFTHAHDYTAGPLMKYVTATGIDKFIQKMVFSLPRYYISQPSRPTCIGNDGWGMPYALYSGAIFSHHFWHLPIIAKFDYILKVDTDIEFRKQIPIDIGADMELKGCSVAHSSILGSNDCEKNNYNALIESGKALGLPPPKSGKYGWCHRENEDQGGVYFQGNFVGWSTKFVLNETIQRLTSHMYYDTPGGYFAYRWTDQAPLIMYTCQMLDIPDINKDPQICDYTYFRDEYMHHY